MEHIDHPPVPVRDPAARMVRLVCEGILVRYASSWVRWQMPAHR